MFEHIIFHPVVALKAGKAAALHFSLDLAVTRAGLFRIARRMSPLVAVAFVFNGWSRCLDKGALCNYCGSLPCSCRF
jgi:hypothetical protein